MSEYTEWNNLYDIYYNMNSNYARAAYKSKFTILIGEDVTLSALSRMYNRKSISL